ncbi:hypothetical protein FACS189454_09970 [Planctomycetales bacterium]|nr:hypothetical protein FACS189454_09970 [Planctomycetales bacterium]
MKQLAKDGTITPETVVENEEGQKGRAKQIKELVFAQPVANPVSQDNASVYGFKQEQPKSIPVPPPVSRQPPVQQTPAPYRNRRTVLTAGNRSIRQQWRVCRAEQVRKDTKNSAEIAVRR